MSSFSSVTQAAAALRCEPVAELTRRDYPACAGHQVSTAQTAILSRQGVSGQEAGLQGCRLHDDHRDDDPADICQQFQTQRLRNMVSRRHPGGLQTGHAPADRSKADLPAALQGARVHAVQLQRGTRSGGRSAADTASNSATYGRTPSLSPAGCLQLHDDRQTGAH